MKPALQKREHYRSTNKLSQDFGCHSMTIYRLSVKNRFRFFKFNGVRCLEVNDAICLLKILHLSRKISDETYERNLDKLQGLLWRG